MDWAEWHKDYDDPATYLAKRLVSVKRWIVRALDDAPEGPIRLVSMCAGQGRDLLEVLPGHPRRADVKARLVELNPDLASHAEKTALDAGLTDVEVVVGDAADTSMYQGMVPAEIVLVCGVFGNVTDKDILHTIGRVRMLCATGGTVIWTRGRHTNDITPVVRRWFTGAGFEELGFDTRPDTPYGVGANRYTGEPQPFEPNVKMFEFTR